METTSAKNSARLIPVFRTSPFRPIKAIVDDVGQAFEQLGDVIQIKGFPVSVFCLRDPKHIETLFYHPIVGGTKFPAILPRVKRVMRTGAYILEGGDEWKDRRIPVQKGFKGEYLNRYLQPVPPLVEKMIHNWNMALDRSGAVDIVPGLQSLITQVNFKQYFSIDLDGEELESVRRQTHFVELNFVKPLPLWLPLPAHLEFDRHTRALRTRFLELVRNRRTAPQASHDALAILLNAEHKRDGKTWTDEEIVDEMFSIYFGASVMATTLAWALYLVGSHAAAQDTLRTEAQRAHANRLPLGTDLEHLPYSEMVIWETLRIYPPSWGFPRYTQEGFTFDGFEIPAKSLVIPMIYHTHRHPGLWEHPADFRPERFGPSAPKRPNLAFFPFGSGQRPCLGINLAPLIMRLVLSQIAAALKFSFSPRFAGDPVADFGFEIHPADAVILRKVD